MTDASSVGFGRRKERRMIPFNVFFLSRPVRNSKLPPGFLIGVN